MKRLATVLAVLLAGAVLVAPAARAGVDRVTITGPAVAPYYSTVTLSGHTPHAGDMVRVYVRRVGDASFRSSPALTADAHHAYSYSFRLAGDHEFYAAADGERTPTHTVAIARATCSTSGPAFTTYPFASWNQYDKQELATFTATRDGIWAGFAWNGLGSFAVTRWSRAHGLHVVDRFDYEGGYSPTDRGSIRIAGITPGGVIVAGIQANHLEPGDPEHYTGMYWIDGVRHLLARPTAASWVRPLRVLDDGSILGVASNPHHHFSLISWAGVAAAPRTLLGLGRDGEDLAVDSAGDVLLQYSGFDDVRLRDGTLRRVASPAPYETGLFPLTAARNSVYAIGVHGVIRFDFSAPPASGPITGTLLTARTGPYAWAHGAGAYSRVLLGDDATQYLRLSDGRLGTLPRQRVDLGEPGVAIDGSGSVAFASATDGLPRFATCH